MVKKHFIQKQRKVNSAKISEPVSKWIGILKTKKTYKKLRDEHIDSRVKIIIE
ncbi:MAG: hypothetical protein HZB30_11585 [Nitrospirae bacterium]|nr:hypothetical protein [Nitrospirota bacterium]